MREMTDAAVLEKVLNLFGSQIVAAGLQAEIPIEDIGTRFLAVVTEEEEAREFECLLRKTDINHVLEVTIGEMKFYFQGE